MARLQEQLQKEKNSRANIEVRVGLELMIYPMPIVMRRVVKFTQRWLIMFFDHSTNSEPLNLIQARTELEELALVEMDLSNLERMVQELGVRLNVKLERNVSDRKYKADTEVGVTSQYESDTERKPDWTPLLNKQPPTGSKKYGSKSGEVGF